MKRAKLFNAERMTHVGLAALLVALFLAAFESKATVVVIHPLDEMTRKADLVVHARVSDQRVVRDEGRILTLTELEVLDGMKGAKYGDVLTVYQVGGVLDGVTAKIAGMHEYFLGEELVLFAMRHGDAETVVSYGVGVGKFQVHYDGSFGKVVEDLSDIVVLKKGFNGEAVFEAPVPRTSQSLESFKDEIRTFVRTDRAKPMPFKPRLLPGQAPVLHRKGAN